MARWRQVLPLEILDVDYEKLVLDLNVERRRLVARRELARDERCRASFH